MIAKKFLTRELKEGKEIITNEYVNEEQFNAYEGIILSFAENYDDEDAYFKGVIWGLDELWGIRVNEFLETIHEELEEYYDDWKNERRDGEKLANLIELLEKYKGFDIYFKDE